MDDDTQTFTISGQAELVAWVGDVAVYQVMLADGHRGGLIWTRDGETWDLITNDMFPSATPTATPRPTDPVELHIRRPQCENLRRAGYATMDDLASANEAHILRAHQVGRGTLNHIRDLIRRMEATDDPE